MKTIYETDQEFICDIQSPCFQTLSLEEVELIRASKTQVQFRKGDSLTKQGAFASYVLFVMKGLVKQYVEGDNNRSFNLKIIQPGEFIGLASVFSKNIFNYSAVAVTECQVFLIEKDAIRGIIKNNGLFGLSIINRYCEQNTLLFNVLQNLHFKQMNGRLADTLLYIESLKKTFPDIFMLLQRKDLADFAGISVESTVKLLKVFEKDQLLVLQEKDILIKDISKLEQISKNG
jgi:CRP/FNR family transcriptional regulator